MELKDVEILIEEKRYHDALERCIELINERPEMQFDVSRKKAYIHSLLSEYEYAIQEIARIVDMNQANISDYFLGAFWSLYAGKLDQATDWFESVLQMSEAQKNDWFKAGTIFYLSHIRMELGQFEEAEKLLSDSASGTMDAPILVPNVGWCTFDQLRNEIRLRASESANQDSDLKL